MVVDEEAEGGDASLSPSKRTSLWLRYSVLAGVLCLGLVGALAVSSGSGSDSRSSGLLDETALLESMPLQENTYTAQLHEGPMAKHYNPNVCSPNPISCMMKGIKLKSADAIKKLGEAQGRAQALAKKEEEAKEGNEQFLDSSSSTDIDGEHVATHHATPAFKPPPADAEVVRNAAMEEKMLEKEQEEQADKILVTSDEEDKILGEEKKNVLSRDSQWKHEVESVRKGETDNEAKTEDTFGKRNGQERAELKRSEAKVESSLNSQVDAITDSRTVQHDKELANQAHNAEVAEEKHIQDQVDSITGGNEHAPAKAHEAKAEDAVSHTAVKAPEHTSEHAAPEKSAKESEHAPLHFARADPNVPPSAQKAEEASWEAFQKTKVYQEHMAAPAKPAAVGALVSASAKEAQEKAVEKAAEQAAYDAQKMMNQEKEASEAQARQHSDETKAESFQHLKSEMEKRAKEQEDFDKQQSKAPAHEAQGTASTSRGAEEAHTPQHASTALSNGAEKSEQEQASSSAAISKLPVSVQKAEQASWEAFQKSQQHK